MRRIIKLAFILLIIVTVFRLCTEGTKGSENKFSKDLPPIDNEKENSGEYN